MADLEIFRKTLGNMGTNCYILVNHDMDECVVFDPADEVDVLKEIFDTPSFKLQAIFLTHGHYDHIGAVKALREAYGVPVYASKEEDAEVLGNLEVNLSAMFGNAVTLQADEVLRDSEELEIIGTKIKCILTPGHTAGGMCYYIEELKSLIAGDTLFAGSVGRTDFPTGNGAKLINSIHEKLFILPDDTKVFPGHMDATTIGYEKVNNMVCGL
ncbi:MAG: MBL fold metallo-hydrolase [Lachnospiraceae bacterium]|nr:MBL fold metallo-hydrolase [Lachnospiraceae bacterium]